MSGAPRPSHATPEQATAAARLGFRPAQRISTAADFQAAFGARARKSAGPLTLFAGPSASGVTRLGLSVGRRFGNAVTRNRFKRAMREAFRLEQHALPAGVDLVITTRAHTPLPLARYRELLVNAATRAAAELRKRGSLVESGAGA